MKTGFGEAWRIGYRGGARIFDGVRASPLGVLVFFSSVALLIYLEVGSAGAIRADAVAQAIHVDHPAHVATFVVKVHVRSGQMVDAGAPLVDLSPVFIDRELETINAEVERMLYESALAQARLVVEEQRWLQPGMRMAPDRPSLQGPTDSLYATELALLHTRRKQLLQDRAALTVTSNASGRIVLVAAPGSPVAAGGSVASLSPEYAEEIVAYVPSTTRPDEVLVGAPVRISKPGNACPGTGSVLRRGATVEEAPRQLSSFFRFPIHGMPVYISIPDGCSLGVGQVLTVEFTRALL